MGQHNNADPVMGYQTRKHTRVEIDRLLKNSQELGYKKLYNPSSKDSIGVGEINDVSSPNPRERDSNKIGIVRR